MNRSSTLLSTALLFFAASGCVTPGPYVRVATATPSDIAAANDKDVVWYEFQKGDVVPFHFLFFGALEGAADAAPLRAKRQFYLVMRKNLPMLISFDGTTFASAQSSQSIISVMPGEGAGGQVGWFHYLGESATPEEELEALLKKKN